MSDENSEAQGYGQEEAREPSPDLKRLDRLVGTWELSGDVGGTVTYEWMEGGFFLLQRVDLGREGSGMEVIGHERGYGAEPSADIKSRFYSSTGDTLDYVYELEGDTLTIWFGERESPRTTEVSSATMGTPSRARGTIQGAATRRSRPGSRSKHRGGEASVSRGAGRPDSGTARVRRDRRRM